MPPKPAPGDTEGKRKWGHTNSTTTPTSSNTAEEARSRLAEMEREREQEQLLVEPNSNTPAEDERNISRLTQLAALLRREQTNVHVTNMALEIGRPTLQPPPNMRGDPTNMYSQVSTDFLWKIKPQRISNNMATSEDMVKIQVTLEGLGVPTESVKEVIIRLVLNCANTSSSVYQDPKGVIEWDGGAIIADDVVGAIMNTAHLEKYAVSMQAVAWNYMHLQQTPPSDWSAMGFHPNVKYAAFDFFDYVENGAAIRPSGGIVPKPTRAEYVAYNTYKMLALNKANNKDTFGNFDSAITGGRQGPASSQQSEQCE
uniref:Capsid protein n=1 Tax=Chrysanthemum virus B TaxID=12165 RepID=Q70HV6_CVB|nr:coat protein [Chrysanthemum virus B]CAO78686.1 coat protein [Chrysanthemum virus B]